MPFAPDSTEAGYLGPTDYFPQDDAWEDFLNAVVQGITQIDPTLVRPRWQLNPPNTPDRDVNWVSPGILRTEADWMPAIVHYDKGAGGLGVDLMQRHEYVVYLCSFYGPQAEAYAARLRDGLFVAQNLAVFRANGVGLVEVSDIMRTPELFRQQFRPRADLDIRLRREVRRVYQVRNLVAAVAGIAAEAPGGKVIYSDAVVGLQRSVTVWDDGATTWDDALTFWDRKVTVGP